MSPKITDPNTFLVNLVSKKGKSELCGVYLTGVNVLADSTEDYGYEGPTRSPSPECWVQTVFNQDKDDWNRLLCDTRRFPDEIIHPISFLHGKDPVTVYFVCEGTEMSCMVFIPTLSVEEFPLEVTFFQHLCREVAHFAGRSPGSIRFILGVVSMEWEDVVERGCAREVDVGF